MNEFLHRLYLKNVGIVQAMILWKIHVQPGIIQASIRKSFHEDGIRLTHGAISQTIYRMFEQNLLTQEYVNKPDQGRLNVPSYRLSVKGKELAQYLFSSTNGVPS